MRLDRDRPITGTRCCASGKVSNRSSLSRRRLRMAGAAVQVPLCDRARHHRTRWNGWVFFGLKNHRGRT